MNKQNLQNKKLDQISRKMLEKARVSNDEIEQIVNSAQLFNSVKAKINAEQCRREEKGFTGLRGRLQILDWRNLTGAFAILIVLFVGLMLIFTKPNAPQLVEKNKALEIQAPKAPIEFSSATAESIPAIEKTKVSIAKDRISAQRASFKAETTAPQKTALKLSSVKRKPTEKKTIEGEFYALAYAGNPGEIGQNLHIVRAELSPASLFALGVNVPIENESKKIKTDLLVGSDGVARAIRFVK